MIAIVDYGMGNLKSLEGGLKKVGCEVLITRDPAKIKESQGLVLPGVGSFRDCMINLKESKLIHPIFDFIASGRPFLGICLGMQILFSESEEFGRFKGLNIIKGRVVRFPSQKEMKIPHMGWNTVKIKKVCPLLKDIPDESYFYFVHSYYVDPEDKDVIATTTYYGVEFTSGIWKDNIFACQFHPEKSQKLGLKILRKFGGLTKNVS